MEKIRSLCDLINKHISGPNNLDYAFFAPGLTKNKEYIEIIKNCNVDQFDFFYFNYDKPTNKPINNIHKYYFKPAEKPDLLLFKLIFNKKFKYIELGQGGI